MARHDERRTSAAAAAHFQHILTPEIHGARDMIVELDAIAIFFIRVAEKKPVSIGIGAGESIVPEEQVLMLSRPPRQELEQTPVEAVPALKGREPPIRRTSEPNNPSFVV